MKNNSNAEYLPLRLLFVAYARMLDTRKMFPTVRDYYEKRYRILSGLFEAHLADTLGLDELASRYTRASSIDPCEGVILGSNGIDRLSGYISSMRELRRHAADMRRIYARLGVEWLIEHCPGIEERRVHVSRLKEFGIIPKPPNAVDECFKAMEMDAGEEEPANDDVPAFVSAELMRGTNENTNGLIRQYFPKGMNLSKVTQEQCEKVAEILNNRPRKRHGFRTPNEMYALSPIVALQS